MYNILKKFLQYGIVTVNYPKRPVKGDFITGMPVVDEDKCTLCGNCISECPTHAIKFLETPKKKISFDLNKCIFCRFCEEVCPSKAACISSQFELAVNTRDEIPSSDENETNDYEIIGQKLQAKIAKKFGRSLFIREVDAGSCNGCDNECNALNGPYNDIERLGISFVASPRHADMLLVTGPVTKNMELALVKTYNATPDPKLVVAVGSCAASGGIFRESYAVNSNLDRLIPVDVYIPGCPPRPQALIYGILKAVERIK